MARIAAATPETAAPEQQALAKEIEANLQSRAVALAFARAGADVVGFDMFPTRVC
jgi:hypothetical protein